MPSLIRTLLRPHPEYIGFAMRVAYTVMAVLISILLARLLGPAALGRYFEVVAWILLVGIIGQSGWAGFLVREVAALREMRRYAELRGLTRMALRAVALISLATAAIFLVASWFFAARETFELFLVGAPVVLLLSTITLRQAITRGMGHPLRGLIAENLARPGFQLLGLALLASGLIAVRPTPIAAMAIFLVAIAASAAVAFALQRPLMRETQTAEAAVLPPRSEWLGPLIRTAAVGWSQAINLQIGTILLGVLSTDVEIANFRIAQQLAALLAFGLIVIAAMYPKDFSRLFVRGELAALERLAAKGALIGGATAAGIGLVFLIGGQSLIALAYGKAFAAAFAPLAVMIVGQLVNTVFGPVGTLAIATRNEKLAMRVHLLSVAANVLLCILLVPAWGAVGAAAGAAFSMAAWNIALYLMLRRRLGISAWAGAYFLRR